MNFVMIWQAKIISETMSRAYSDPNCIDFRDTVARARIYRVDEDCIVPQPATLYPNDGFHPEKVPQKMGTGCTIPDATTTEGIAMQNQMHW